MRLKNVNELNKEKSFYQGDLFFKERKATLLKIFAVLLLIFMGISSAFAQTHTEKYQRVKIQLCKGCSVSQIAQWGIALDHSFFNKQDNTVVAELSQKEVDKLKMHGVTYELLIDDLSNYYAKRVLEKTSSSNKTTAGSCFQSKTYQRPTGFVNGSFAGFYSYQEILDQLDSLSTKYPNIVKQKTVIDTFKTFENRPIHYIKISDNPNVDENEPKILFDALHHAREPMSMMQLFFFMNYLCEHYTSDPEIKYFVDHSEMYFVPCVNPDGYEYNRTTNPNGGGLWRKNRRNNGGSYGVDLNRNYDFNWGYDNIGSSPTATNDTYRGPTAASEPETKAMQYLAQTYPFQMNISFHCFGNMLLYPWGYHGLNTTDSVIYYTHAQLMTRGNRFRFGQAIQTVGYNGNGSSFDWHYGDTLSKPKCYAYTPEAGKQSDGFWPTPSNFDAICNENMPLNINALRSLLRYAEVDDIGDQYITNTNSFVPFLFNNMGLQSGNFTVRIIPLSGNFTAGAPKNIMVNGPLFQTQDSISIQLNAGVQNGDLLRYILQVDNGNVLYNDTISKYYATQVNTLFIDDCNSLQNFTSTTNWNTTTNYFTSNHASIADNNIKRSANNQNKTIYTPAINLIGATHATVSYNVRFVTETQYDYAQLVASTDNGATKSALCTKHSLRSDAFSNKDEPVYNGVEWNWRHDEAELTDYLGKQIKLGFHFSSDQGLTRDGFYFDDIVIRSIGTSVVGVQDKVKQEIKVYPNPANTYLLIENTQEAHYQLLDIQSKKIQSGQLIQGKINLSDVASGAYFLKLSDLNQKTNTIKIQVIK